MQSEMFSLADVASTPPWLDPRIAATAILDRQQDTDHIGESPLGRVGAEVYLWVVQVRRKDNNQVLASWPFSNLAEANAKLTEVRNRRRSA